MANKGWGLVVRRELVQRYYLFLKHEGKSIAIAHPFFGPNNYKNLSDQIGYSRLIKPTIGQVISVVHSAHHTDNCYSREIVQKRGQTFWRGFSGILWTKDGVYVQDNPKIKDGLPAIDEKELQEKITNSYNLVLQNKEGTIRFTKPGFKIGEMNSREFERNSLVEILLGKKGAEKAAELIKDRYSDRGYLSGLTDVRIPLIRVSAVDACRNSLWFSLHAADVDSRNCLAFGIKR